MPNPWFRVYHEMVHDPKVQIIPEHMRWRLIAIMCLRCSETLGTLHETEIAFSLRISMTELAETKLVFIAKGFIDENWKILNWEKRQFASDSSTERVRAHREKKKSATLFDETDEKRSSNGLESDTESEQIQKNTPASTAIAITASKGKVLGTLPLNDGSDWQVFLADVKELQPLYPAVDVLQELRNMKGWLIGNPENRKTKRGIRRFITHWLSSAQDKAKPNGRGNANGKSADRAYSTAADLIQEIEDRHGAHAGELLSGGGTY